ncbi:MAG: U32 family peptidase, partial [Hyphomonadaceae bacterium]|nr:U32 family peptidase [Clostridia bacterium]
KMEIEVFGHGALCVCYSGQCLFSSMIGGRSGNRGQCAQPCRLPYEISTHDGKVLSPKKYYLSPKDLMSADHLNGLKKAGVHSLKLEGRMKRAEYVAAVTRVYRACLDQHTKPDEAQRALLEAVFNREGFTAGYLTGHKDAGMMSVNKPGNHGVLLGQVKQATGKGVQWVTTTDLHSSDVLSFRTPTNEVECPIRQDYQKGQTVSLTLPQAITMPCDIYRIFDAQLMHVLADDFKEGVSIRKIPISGQIQIKLAQKLYMTIYDMDGNVVQGTGETSVQTALNRATTQEDIQKQLDKLGGTPYTWSDLAVLVDDGVYVPVSEINGLRRDLLTQLSDARTSRTVAYKANQPKKMANKKSKTPQISVSVHNKEQANALLDCAIARLYVPLDAYEGWENILHHFQAKGTIIAVQVPRIIKQCELQNIKKCLHAFIQLSVTTLLISNIGQIGLFDEAFTLIGDSGLNVMNNESARCLTQLGLTGVTLSPELTLKQIGGVVSSEQEMIGYGYLPLMIMENCPVGVALEKCEGKCQKQQLYLKDRMGAAFPIKTDNTTCRTELFNSTPLYMADKAVDIILAGVDVVRLCFTIESPVQCLALFASYEKAIKHNVMQQASIKDFTRGHYFKGVE